MERYNITVKENPFDGCPYADMVVSDDGAYMRYDDAQRALDAEREKVAAYDRWLSGGVYFTTQEYDDHIAHHNQQLATLQAQLVAEQQRADRAVKDRSDVLYVKTKEGLSCSEWLMRTAIAERKVKDLEAQLRQVEGEVTALRAENARLREALEAIADGPGTNGYCTQYERYMVELAQAALTPAAGGTRR